MYFLRYASLLSSLLQLMDFSEKCEKWILFVTQAEKGLVADVAGSCESLMDQARFAFYVNCSPQNSFVLSLIR